MDKKEITPEQIQQWKQKHGDVYRISVAGDSGETHTGYFRKPSRKTVGYAAMAGKDNPVRFTEALMQDCWLGGDESLRTDDSLFLSAGAKLAELVQVKEAELEKL